MKCKFLHGYNTKLWTKIPATDHSITSDIVLFGYLVVAADNIQLTYLNIS